MDICIREVKGWVRNDIPEDDEVFYDGKDVAEIFPELDRISIYKREKIDCPFNRGNWLVDIHCKSGQLICFKLPYQMEKQHVIRHMQPLLDLLNKQREKLNDTGV